MIDFLTDFRFIIIKLLFFTFFGTFAILLVTRFYNKRKKIIIFSICALLINVIVLVLLNLVLSSMIITDIADKSQKALSENGKVTINGIELEDNVGLLSDLIKVNGWYFPNRRLKGQEFKIQVISEHDTLNLKLFKVLESSNEYIVLTSDFDYELDLDVIKTTHIN
jgi:hypothetical protein